MKKLILILIITLFSQQTLANEQITVLAQHQISHNLLLIQRF